MTEEQRFMIQGLEAFFKHIEYSFRNDKETLKKLLSIYDQTYYDITFNEFQLQNNNHFNIFNILL